MRGMAGKKEEMMCPTMQGCGLCRCVCKCGKGLGLLLVGLIFLAKTRGWMSAMMADTLWPLVLVVLGALMLLSSACPCWKKGR